MTFYRRATRWSHSIAAGESFLLALLLFISPSYTLAENAGSSASTATRGTSTDAVASGTEDAPEVPRARYLRHFTMEMVDTGEKNDYLQTAIVRFEKDGTTVDLVGVIHFADASYFSTLNERLKEYDAVLYEMVGGPVPAAKEGEGLMEAKTGLRSMAASLLGLEDQLAKINYGAENFVHADVNWDELKSMMAEQGDLATWLERLMSASDPATSMTGDSAPSLEQIVSALIAGDSVTLKRAAAPLMGDAERYITQMEGEAGSPLIAGRNEAVLKKLGEIIATRGPGHYAVLYGAGHMPDLEKRLLEDGYQKRMPEEWLYAWSITESASGARPATSPVEGIMRALSGNPDAQKAVETFGKLFQAFERLAKQSEP